MKTIKSVVLPIFLATTWISISEFVRNSILLNSYWKEHYQQLGMIFPEQPINGAIWGIWSMGFAVVMFIISKKFTFIQSTMLSWFIGFILMWLVIGNLGVLPIAILIYAIPLSILEVFLANYILFRFQK